MAKEAVYYFKNPKIDFTENLSEEENPIFPLLASPDHNVEILELQNLPF